MKRKASPKASKTLKRPIVTCAMCKKHVTKQLEVRYQGKRYCCADCADACKKAAR